MGLPNWRVALQVTLPLARRGIAAGLTIGCARALGEYGATLMVGGDINGKTRHDVARHPRLVHHARAGHDVAGPGLDGRHRHDRRGAARPEPRMTAALELAVARRIGEFDLDVAFSVESGISVLFGPSGAGKSLTLALIAGLIRPDTRHHRRSTAVSSPTVPTGPTSAPKIAASAWSSRTACCCRTAPSCDNVALAVRQASGRRARRAVARSWLERVGAEGSVRPPTGLAVGRPAPAGGAGTRPRRRPGLGVAGRAALRPRRSRCAVS